MTLESLTTWIVHIKGPIFAKVPLTALARRVCLITQVILFHLTSK